MLAFSVRVDIVVLPMERIRRIAQITLHCVGRCIILKGRITRGEIGCLPTPYQTLRGWLVGWLTADCMLAAVAYVCPVVYFG